MGARIDVVGQEGNAILLADGASRRTQFLREAAMRSRFSAAGSPHYPGVRAPASEGYAPSLAAALTPPLLEALGGQGTFVPVASSFSLVTTRPENLTPFQRLPHFDGTDPDIVAVLHYLCDADMGGTAFFRHRSTGFETVTAARHGRFGLALRADLARHGMPGPRYHRGTDAIYEQTASVEAVPGRVIAYSGMLLHSGCIPEDFAFPEDPASGRLTVNTFLRRVCS